MAYLETPVGIKLNEFETIMNITLKLNEREFQFSLYYIIPLGKWKENLGRICGSGCNAAHSKSTHILLRHQIINCLSFDTAHRGHRQL